MGGGDPRSDSCRWRLLELRETAGGKFNKHTWTEITRFIISWITFKFSRPHFSRKHLRFREVERFAGGLTVSQGETKGYSSGVSTRQRPPALPGDPLPICALCDSHDCLKRIRCHVASIMFRLPLVSVALITFVCF